MTSNLQCFIELLEYGGVALMDAQGEPVGYVSLLGIGRNRKGRSDSLHRERDCRYDSLSTTAAIPSHIPWSEASSFKDLVESAQWTHVPQSLAERLVRGTRSV